MLGGKADSQREHEAGRATNVLKIPGPGVTPLGRRPEERTIEVLIFGVSGSPELSGPPYETAETAFAHPCYTFREHDPNNKRVTKENSAAIDRAPGARSKSVEFLEVRVAISPLQRCEDTAGPHKSDTHFGSATPFPIRNHIQN